MNALENPRTATDATEQSVQRRLQTLRDQVSESGPAVALLIATAAALVWANSPWSGTYLEFWSTPLSARIGDLALSLDLAHWVNDGLMAIFFMLIGLEIRREFDLGELRERRRVAVPVIAAIGGMALPVMIFLALNAGTEGARGWAMVMSTDTAFALGVLAVVGHRSSRRLRVFILTLVIVDDVAAVTVIGVAYTSSLQPVPLAIALALLVAIVVLRRFGVERTGVYGLLTAATWLATLESGVHPTVAGVAVGLLTGAYAPRREELGRAAHLVRAFRQQPGPELARAATRRISSSLSPNERLQHAISPWSSYVIVPLFALANAGIPIGGDVLGHALASRLTIGVVLGLVIGKPVGITIGAWLATRRRLGGLPLTVSWPSLIAGASVCGIGFTMSLLIAELSYADPLLDEAKLGILGASAVAALLSVLIFHAVALLPADLLRRAEARAAPPLSDLVVPVDRTIDHLRVAPASAPGTASTPPPSVVLVEYADFECPWCGRAAPIVRDLLRRSGGQVLFVVRHLPLTDIHPNAALAAEAAEAAGAQGRFWEMYDRLFAHQDELSPGELIEHARSIGLDVERFAADLTAGTFRDRVARDVATADASGVAGTPTFFVNDVRYRGPVNEAAIGRALQRAGVLARARGEVALGGETG